MTDTHTEANPSWLLEPFKGQVPVPGRGIGTRLRVWISHYSEEKKTRQVKPGSHERNSVRYWAWCKMVWIYSCGTVHTKKLLKACYCNCYHGYHCLLFVWIFQPFYRYYRNRADKRKQVAAHAYSRPPFGYIFRKVRSSVRRLQNSNSSQKIFNRCSLPQSKRTVNLISKIHCFYCFQCWVQDLSVFFVFFVTLTCFPAIQAGIERVSDNFILNSKFTALNKPAAKRQ